VCVTRDSYLVHFLLDSSSKMLLRFGSDLHIFGFGFRFLNPIFSFYIPSMVTFYAFTLHGRINLDDSYSYL